MSLSFFFCKRKTAYDILTSDWSSDVCSSVLEGLIEDEYLSKQPRLASIRHFDQLDGYSGQACSAFPDENERYAQQKDRGLQGYRLPSRHRLPHEGGTGAEGTGHGRALGQIGRAHV